MKKRRFGSLLIVFILMMQAGLPMMVYAAEGKVTVAVSSSSVGVGDTVTITASSSGPNGEKAVSTMEINYDSSVFSFISCGVDTYSGGEGGIVRATASTYSIKLKAVASGSASVKVSGSDGRISETQEALSSMEAAGTVISVGGSSQTAGTEDNSNKSADNSLSELKLSAGTLSPEFIYSETNYKASVPGDVTNIEVEAVPSNSKAEIESITGNSDLQVGENTIKITVKAENGLKVVYTVVVTRDENVSAGEGDTGEGDTGDEAAEEGIVINGVSYEVTGEFSDEAVPKDFSKETLSYKGQEVAGAKFNNGELWLLYLTSEDENAKNGFYVYENNFFQPYLRLTAGEKYIITLPAKAAETVPAGHDEAAVAIDETEGVSGYTYTGEAGQEGAGEFYLLYGMNNEGTKGWYRYDSVDHTLQRFIEAYASAGGENGDSSEITYLQEEYQKLDEKYTKEKSSSRKMTAVFIFITVVLVIVIINILLLRDKNIKEKLFNRKKERDIWDDDEEEEITTEEKGTIANIGKKEEDDMDIEEEQKEHNDRDDDKKPDSGMKDNEDDLEIIDLNDL